MRVKSILTVTAIMLAYVIAICPSITQAQISKTSIGDDLRSNERTLRFSTEKISNTVVSSALLDGVWNGKFGNLSLSQRYVGTTIVSANAASRDEQNLTFTYDTPFDSTLSFISKALMYFTKDSRDIGLSSLERYSITSGLRLFPITKTTLTILGGVEQNKQLGVQTLGKVLVAEADVKEIELDDFSFSFNSSGDIRYLDEQRTNSDIISRFSLLSLGDTSFNSISLIGYFHRQERDFYTFVNTEQSKQVEKRLEDRYGLNGHIEIGIFKNTDAYLDFQVQNTSIDRRYAGPVTGALQTLINRGLTEFQLQMTTGMQLKMNSSLFRIGFSLFRRDETNIVTSVFDINASDEQTLRKQEAQRDNNALRTRLFVQCFSALSASDSLSVEGTTSLMRYDTPSEANYDDRDELQLIGEIRYTRRISPVISFNILARTQFTHLVFIKEQRSSLNNWNRIVSFSPYLTITGKVWNSKPKFEVLANYTTYDFEQSSVDVKSFSFRQLSFRDSILINYANQYHSEIRLYARHFERGRLYWTSFSETPLNKNDEYFAKILIFRDFMPSLSVGCGARYYALIQKNLTSMVATGVSSDAVQRFYGPEVQISYKSSVGSTVSLNGWYERQTVNGVTLRYVPNLFLHTTIML